MSAPHLLPTTNAVRLPRLGLSGLLARLGDRLHADEDARAIAAGYEVTRTRFGGRSYRHPGFAARSTGQDVTR